MSFVAFTLTDEYAGEQPDGTPIFGGGQIAKIDGTTFDIGQELEDGEGTIVLADNDPLVDQLRAYPALEQVPVPEYLPGDEAPAPKSAKSKSAKTTDKAAGDAGEQTEGDDA